MSKFKIRPFNHTDTEQVKRLWGLCNLIFPANDPDLEIQEKMSFQPDLFFVGIYESLLIGTIMVGYDGHRGWINYLAVHPNYQRKGFGTALMNYATDLLTDMGCSKINVQIRQYNTSVIDFYTHLGFTNDRVVSYGKRLRFKKEN